MASASPGGVRYYVAMNVSTLSFANAEGVIAAGWTHYGWIAVNGALVGANGLTITTHDQDDEGTVYLNADNRNLYVSRHQRMTAFRASASAPARRAVIASVGPSTMIRHSIWVPE